MIAYNKNALDIRRLRQIVDQLAAAKLLSAEETQNIKAHYPDQLYTPHLFVRIGFGLLTLIASAAVFGLLLLMTDGSVPTITCLIIAILSLFALEFFIREKKHFRAGVDDVLLHLTIFYCIAAFVVSNSFSDHSYSLFFFVSVIGYFIGAFRYLNRLAAALVPISCCLFIFSLFSTLETPFFVYFLAAIAMAGMFFLLSADRQQAWPYHAGCFLWARIAAVVACYASLHYHTYAITHYYADFVDEQLLASHARIIFLWAWTILFPFGVLYYGIRKASNTWIRVALVLIFSIGYFYHLYLGRIEPELGAILAGVIIICLSSYLILRLQQKKSKRFVYDPGTGADSLLVPAALAGMARLPAPAADQSTRFEGGSFGGGGAGADF
ncbi:MAG: hypothetical protein QM664_08165 [Flavihumibacter sp.]